MRFGCLMVQEVVETAQSYVYLVAISLVILIVGFALGVIAKKLLRKILKEVELNKLMLKLGIMQNIEMGIATTVSYLIYLVTIVLFLDYLGIKSIVIYLIVGALLILFILTLAIGLKDIVPNFMGYLLLQKKGLIKEGKIVDVKGISGKVEKIGVLETEIETEKGDILYVPNSLFLKSEFWLRKQSKEEKKEKETPKKEEEKDSQEEER